MAYGSWFSVQASPSVILSVLKDLLRGVAKNPYSRPLMPGTLDCGQHKGETP